MKRQLAGMDQVRSKYVENGEADDESIFSFETVRRLI